MVPGPHVVGCYVALAAAGSTSADDLVTDQAVAGLIHRLRPRHGPGPAHARPHVLRVVGPAGAIAGPFTVTDPTRPERPQHPRRAGPPADLRVVGCRPTQADQRRRTTVTLAPDVQSAATATRWTATRTPGSTCSATPRRPARRQTYTSGGRRPDRRGAAGHTLDDQRARRLHDRPADAGPNLLSSVLVQLNIHYPNDPDLEADPDRPRRASVVQLFTTSATPAPARTSPNTIFDDQRRHADPERRPAVLRQLQPARAAALTHARRPLRRGGTWTLGMTVNRPAAPAGRHVHRLVA